MVEAGRLTSMILWGPAGTGKTSLARLVAQNAGYHAEALSAVTSGVKDVREVLERAQQRRGEFNIATVLFLDEVHRFNKAQQDLLLPATESGLLVLIGATTENPSFEVNAALMSRCTLWRVHALNAAALGVLVDRGALIRQVSIEPTAREVLIRSADGDGRSMLTTLDTACVLASDGSVTFDHVAQARDGRIMHQSADTHYDQVSALIKSIRGSDPDAAVYWLLALLEAGESARFIARRLVIAASEDIGLANNAMLTLAESCARAVEMVGLPEAQLTLVHTTLALALSDKSNSATTALAAARAAVRAEGGAVPAHLRDGHYASAASLGHGVGYRYPHDFPGHWVDQTYLPDALVGQRFFTPGDTGDEPDQVKVWLQRRSPVEGDGHAQVE
jgi:putative ATPase